MVGASDDKTKFSYGVLRQLDEIGYEIAGHLQLEDHRDSRLEGLSVASGNRPPDRHGRRVSPKEELTGSPNKPSQSGRRSFRVRSACMTIAPQRSPKPQDSVVMDRCPKIELFRHSGPRLDLELNLPDKPGAAVGTDSDLITAS